ncbi:MAG TPA: UDP-N-acetylmuramoyl-L-alanine--D-glutamate ligase [Salinivirga sp.]|uniref:UDP-N-acetylmuramoyl-L-alanine--D-glutamate ligase n=1 Tax=Salinivirga sp. TaxID=1970192 RepID=UPI002B489F1F|nr:UDP-N-acetylmuramoyl-L-alanine--D-glutamate ligase [Salinivirga sp.]HKK58642.1 UDP-N-acetylmuramoyl-L-alanine--D-glutamate ligase [Salinivirga sp.]
MKTDNPHIAILGAGESGVGSAILAQKQGFELWVSDNGEIKPDYKAELDQYNIPWEEGGHTSEKILTAQTIVKSPGIPETVDIVQQALNIGIEVISEIEFAGRYSNAFMIGITGSNGKTTTTMWTYQTLKIAGLNVGLGGNVGQSFARQVAMKNYDYYVIELSSFQLDGMKKFKCNIAVLLNITPDHLDRYDNNFESYIAAKFRITQNQTENDYLIVNADDPVINEHLHFNKGKAQKLEFSTLTQPQKGAWLNNDKIIFNSINIEFDMIYTKLALEGKHNATNGMAAGIAADILRISKDNIRESLMTFSGVEHRLEPFISVRGVEFINDSKATNINSTWYALESMRKPVIWIVGGIDKGNDYSELDELVRQKVKSIVCLGTDNQKIKNFFEGKVDHITEAFSMKDAVAMAFDMGKKGDCVLLSPACASFDLFDNYEDRGNQFKMSVRAL